ncbi:MAG: amidohydrolase [Clostridia bacterium]|nr:amidohydrolase [Clostridia bacterium]
MINHISKDILAEMVHLRRHLHQYPELSGQEHQTLAFIRSQLEQLSIPFTTYENGGICATIGKGDSAIGIRADIDALSIEEKTGLPYASQNIGVMHACGHDIHTAVLLGLARLLKKEEATLPAMVKLFFQPAEETVGGAKVMVEGGCMEGPQVERVLALHVDPTLPVGTASFLPGKMNAAVIELDIAIHGKSCHGAHPEMGVDAIAAAAQIISALQLIPSRFTAPTEPVVITIGKIQGGTGRNIVAGEVHLQGTVRVLDKKTGDQVKHLIRQTVQGTAAALGAEAEVALTDDYPALINHAVISLQMAELARELMGKENVVMMDAPSMGADDFAYFTQAAPGCYFNIGTAAPGTAPQSLHSEHFAPDEGCMQVGLALLHAGVQAYMETKK